MSTAALAHDVKTAPPVRSGLKPLPVNRPGDMYEQEAERISRDVVSGTSARPAWSLSKIGIATPLQRECSCGGSCEECRKKPKQMLQRDSSAGASPMTAPPVVHDVLSGAGNPLDRTTRSFMESQFGHDFGSVRVFHDDVAAKSARSVAANAFTVGNKIVFNQGRYAPDSQSGRRLLAHELAHVVQQGAARPGRVQSDVGVAPGSEIGGEVIQHSIFSPAETTGTTMLQRDPDPLLTADAAGGCGVCLGGDLRKVGNTAHTLIQTEFQVEYPFLLPEFSVKSPDNTIINQGRPDLVTATKTGFKVGEIKPANPEGYIEGEAKLVIYEKLLKAAYPKSTFERMDLAPVPPVPFVDPVASMSGCPPQTLVTSPGVRGVYGYLCTPPFKDLVGKCKCLRDGDPKPFPVPQDEKDKKKVDEKEKKKVDVPQTAPDLTPVYGVAALAALGFLFSKILPKLGTKAAGPIYAVASLAAMAVLVASGKAEAKVGPGEKEPLAQLFEAMDQQGIQVPPDVRSMIENNPDLKAKLEKSMAKGGDASAAQQAINEQILKIIEAHKDELTPEELGILLDSTRSAGGALPQNAATEQAILKAIHDRKSSGNGNGQGSGDSGAKPQSDATKPADGGAEHIQDGGSPDAQSNQAADSGKAATNTPHVSGSPGAGGLTQAGKQRLAAAGEPVRTLFTSITSGGGGGDAATDATVNEYLSIVPADLTAKEAQILTDRLAANAGKSAADVLESLRKAVAELRPAQSAKTAGPDGGTDTPGQGVGDANQAAKPSQGTEAAGTKDSKPATSQKDKQADLDAEHAALAKLAATGDYSQIKAGQYLISWGSVQDLNAQLLSVDANGVHSAAYVKGKIVKRDDAHKKLTVRIIQVTDLVAANGSIQPPISTLIGKDTELRIPGK